MAARTFSAIVLGALLFATLPLAAQQETRYPLSVVDDQGNTVVVPALPRRIISLTLPTDEILLSLVDKSRLLGVTSFSADPAVSNVADQVTDIRYKLTLNPETIISLAPDLVFAANWNDSGAVKLLRDAGIPLYLMANGLTVAAIEKKIETVAQIVGTPEKGKALVATMEARLAAVAATVSKVPPEKRARVIDYATWGSAQGPGSSWDEIIRRAGLVDAVAAFTPDKWGQVPLSREKILQLDPDILILPGWQFGNPRGAAAFFSQVTGDPGLRGLKAITAGRVYMMPEQLKSCTSQYFTSAVEWLAKTAYPDLFR
jgi:iron complex transport system substrate-binding protein